MAESIVNIHSLVLPFLASVLRGLVIRLQKGRNRCCAGCKQEPRESREDDNLTRQNSMRVSEESELPKCRHKQGNWNLARQTSLSLPFILWSLPCSLLGPASLLTAHTPLLLCLFPILPYKAFSSQSTLCSQEQDSPRVCVHAEFLWDHSPAP